MNNYKNVGEILKLAQNRNWSGKSRWNIQQRRSFNLL